MTIAIVAVTVPDDIIVSVSDRMISFGDVTQAADDGAIKTPSISKHWFTAYAANDLNLVWPIIENVRRRLSGNDQRLEIEVKEAFAAAYLEQFHKEFTSRKLARYGYKSVEEFRKEGRADLGDHFAQLCTELDAFDLGAQFLVYGYDKDKKAHIFEVSCPGHVTDHDLLQYAVIGSGYYMAMASLRRRQMRPFLESTIYRLLEAKFSAETATGVGKRTTVILMNREGSFSLIDSKEVDRIREFWEKTVTAPDPHEVLDYIADLRGLKNVAGEGR